MLGLGGRGMIVGRWPRRWDRRLGCGLGGPVGIVGVWNWGAEVKKRRALVVVLGGLVRAWCRRGRSGRGRRR